VIAGHSHGVAGAMQREVTQPLYLDIHLPAGTQFRQHLSATANAFLYVYEGELEVAGKAVPQQRMAILKKQQMPMASSSAPPQLPALC
jgi:redox-sensitive bicupin YhaK (pirin superfamily)